MVSNEFAATIPGYRLVLRCAAIPNFRIMETDIDRVPWDNEIVIHPLQTSSSPRA